jgi:hypothetical protein
MDFPGRSKALLAPAILASMVVMLARETCPVEAAAISGDALGYARVAAPLCEQTDMMV